jgi:hypothetical protein
MDTRNPYTVRIHTPSLIHTPEVAVPFDLTLLGML